MNLNTKIWGPHAWFLIDSVCIGYPNNPTKKYKKNMKKFIYSLRYLLPCIICRNHFKTFCKNNPLDYDILKSKKKIILWIIKAHNNSNEKNLTLNDFIENYETIYNKKLYIDN